MSAKNDLTRFIDKLRGSITQAASINQTRSLGIEAIRIIRVRTRLGYGVPEQFENRKRLAAFTSEKYVFQRRTDPRLSADTTPTKSNLTYTGQLLDSLAILGINAHGCRIGPSGGRDDGQTNERVARSVAARGRVFLNLSKLEATQLKRFYRRNFGDVLRNQRLTFNKDSKEN
jgi:hypothetical protein